MFNKLCGAPINQICEHKVQQIVESILQNGWVGAPILCHSSIGLITGSHRSAALHQIAELYDDGNLTDEQMDIADKLNIEGNYAMDVTDIVDQWLRDDPARDIQYDRLGPIFEGTEIERWKLDIKEW